MPLSVGDKLGHYEVLSLLGHGGMGEVYRARDTTLKRDVAVKVLPSAFLRDHERMARFQREAEVLASLDHPNIGHIHGIVDCEDSRGLVLALIEGPTLADRIEAGPLPQDEALAIAKQIIEALEYAHERGVVHRDLKPANVKITPDGVVKVLDFGLAKVLEDEPPPSSLANSPTLTLGHTRTGVILGTAAYMSPEQAVGRPVDRRSDIFSFGAVLYEMITGKRAFIGETTPDVLEAVVKNDPDWSKLPSGTPRVIHQLLSRCLTKDRKQRLQAIGEARILLNGPMGESPAQAPPAGRHRSWLPWCIAAFLLLALMPANILHFREQPPQERSLRYTIDSPQNGEVHSAAISPDGHYVVMATAVNDKRQLWLRPMDALQAQPMPTTDGATYPFWSPDSRYIGFFAQGKLKKIDSSGGPAQSLCDVPNAGGGSWNREDVIVFSSGAGTALGGTDTQIQRVPSAGGVPSVVSTVEGDSRYPVFMPDGRHFLYTARRGTTETSGIYMGSLDGKQDQRILPDVSRAVFAPLSSGDRGHILFVRENNLMAQPIHAESGQILGDVFPIAEGVRFVPNDNFALVTVSETGVLLYGKGGLFSGTQIVWFDRAGKLLGPVGEPGLVLTPAISPDEKVIAFKRGASIWLRDLARGADLRFTIDPSPTQSAGPFWSPKGDRIAFTSTRGGRQNLYQKSVGGSGQDELLIASSNPKSVHQWSRDGRYIVYSEDDPKTKRDLWVLSVDSRDRKPTPFLQTEFEEVHGQLSPDSRWMAYASDESGKREVYVRPFPTGDGKWRISTAGGDQPRWRGDGKEMYYAGANSKMMAVAVKTGPASNGATKPSFEPGVPVPLFESHIIAGGAADVVFQYDVTADGKRFLVVTRGSMDAAPAPSLTVVTNWTAGLKK